MDAINIFEQDRGLIQRLLADVSGEAYFTIPPNFDNNLAWNLGHIIVAQQNLIYKLAGLPVAVTETDVAMFKPGTSPADWQHRPDVPRLLDLLADTTSQLGVDYRAGKFETFTAYTTSTGITFDTLEGAVAFNNFHEGLHFGFMMALKNLL